MTLAPMKTALASMLSAIPAARLRNTMFLAGTYVCGMSYPISSMPRSGTGMDSSVSALRKPTRGKSISTWGNL